MLTSKDLCDDIFFCSGMDTSLPLSTNDSLVDMDTLQNASNYGRPKRNRSLPLAKEVFRGRP